MIFALATDENTLMVFRSQTEAMGYCEGVDVKDGGWRFWLGDGTPLRAVFETQEKLARDLYQLQTATELPHLSKSIPSIGQIYSNPYFDSLAAVLGHLAFGPRASQHGT